MMKLPGLIDPHVHMREPGATHKEDWASGTSAALAGGFTVVLGMPNTQPPITGTEGLQIALKAAKEKAHCDYAHFVGAGADNVNSILGLASKSAGLKMYLDQTYGPLRLDELSQWMAHIENWPRDIPLVVHAEERSMAAVILLAALNNRSVHVAHVSRHDEITVIRASKEMGIKVTCEVTPHHLMLTQADITTEYPGRWEVRPRLATVADRDSLWANMDVIDCIATDHAPHTLQEKDSDDPPPGFPGLETALPLMLTAVSEGRLSMDDLLLRMYTNPKRIFNIPDQHQTWIEVDLDAEFEISRTNSFSRCGWTPFEGWRVRGQVRRVVLHGREAFCEGSVMVPPGFGMNLRNMD